MNAARWLVALSLLGTGSAVAQTAPPSAIAVTGDVILSSDYRFRGLSRTGRDPAVQASVAFDTLAGPYVGAFASTIGGYVARGSDAEIDLMAGYRKTLDGTTIDGGLRYFFYPGHGTGDANVAEPFVSASRSYGPLSAKIGGALAWRQRSLGVAGDKRGGAYLYGELAAGIPRTPVSVRAHVGHSFSANAMTLGQRYTDWSLAGSYALHALTLSLAYVDTDANGSDLQGMAGRISTNAAGATVVGSIGIAF